MKSPSKPNQIMLPGMEQAQCACGCGEYFMRVKRGRTRLYVNETHKKRVMRAKRKERASESPVALMPKGWLYFLQKQDDDLTYIWERLTPDQQEIVSLMCEKGMTPGAFVTAVCDLFNLKQGRIDAAARAYMERGVRGE